MEPIKIESGQGTPLKRVGRRLPGVTIGQAEDMLLGRPVPESVVQKAVEASENNHLDMAGHVPTIGALAAPAGAWGVFCLRCSADQEAYVYPCAIDGSDWPPQVLVPAEATGE